MERDRKHQQSGHSGQQAEQHDGQAAHAHKASSVQQRRMRMANEHNQKHPEQVAEFNRLTNNACGGGTYVDFQKVWGWQSTRGLIVSGKIDAATLKAARKEAPKEQPATDGAPIVQHDTEAPDTGGENVFAEDGDAAEGATPEQKLENPALMDNITDGAAGQETHDAGKPGDAIKQTGKGVEYGAKGAKVVGLLKDTSPIVKYLDTPYIVELLWKGEYQKVIDHLNEKYAIEYGKEVVYEALKAFASRAGLPRFSAFLEGFSGAAAATTVAMIKWTYEGLKQIHEAHERGDRDSRIAIYSGAFADAFLFGRGAGNAAGAVTPEQKKAFELGDRDGAATSGATGEQAASVGKALLEKYGDAHGARQAIINALLEHAGIGGVKV
jgi:hypothetical protein